MAPAPTASGAPLARSPATSCSATSSELAKGQFHLVSHCWKHSSSGQRLMRLTIRKVAALTALTIILSGCTTKPDNRPRRVPVTGTVLYKGQPIANATVLFEPANDT